MSMLRKRGRVLLAAASVCLVGVCAWFILSRAEPEPSYQGKPLTFWLAAFDSGNWNPGHPNGPPAPSYEEAVHAFREMGTNGLPYLLRLIQKPHSRFTSLLGRAAVSLHLGKLQYSLFNSANERYSAASAVQAVGPGASNAVPELLQIYDRNPRSAFLQQFIPGFLGSIGPPAQSALPMLLKATTHTNQLVRQNAIYALGMIGESPEVVVPVLARLLNDSSPSVQAYAAHSLGLYGTNAIATVSALKALWSNSPPAAGRGVYLGFGTSWGVDWNSSLGLTADVRSEVRNALESISPDDAAKVGSR